MTHLCLWSLGTYFRRLQPSKPMVGLPKTTEVRVIKIKIKRYPSDRKAFLSWSWWLLCLRSWIQDWFSTQQPLTYQIQGIERRSDLVDGCCVTNPGFDHRFKNWDVSAGLFPNRLFPFGAHARLNSDLKDRIHVPPAPKISRQSKIWNTKMFIDSFILFILSCF